MNKYKVLRDATMYINIFLISVAFIVQWILWRATVQL